MHLERAYAKANVFPRLSQAYCTVISALWDGVRDFDDILGGLDEADRERCEQLVSHALVCEKRAGDVSTALLQWVCNDHILCAPCDLLNALQVSSNHRPLRRIAGSA